MLPRTALMHLDGVFMLPAGADPISNQFEIAAMNIEYDFGLKAEDVVSYKGVKSNDNGDAGLVLVLEAADGKAEDVANQLAAYQQDQVAFYGNYAEFAQAQDNVENAVIAFKGNPLVMVIASNECTADLDSAVDSALAAESDHPSRCHLRHRLFSVVKKPSQSTPVGVASLPHPGWKKVVLADDFGFQHHNLSAALSAHHAGAVLSRAPETQKYRSVFVQSGVLLLGRGAVLPGDAVADPDQLHLRPCHRAF